MPIYININLSKIRKNKFKIIIALIAIIVSIFLIKKINVNKKETNEFVLENGYIAIISDNQYEEGILYNYYIYPDKNNTYKYVKTSLYVNGKPGTVENIIKSDVIKSKDEFLKIQEYMKEDKLGDAISQFSYVYIDNGERRIYSSINKLADKIFGN